MKSISNNSNKIYVTKIIGKKGKEESGVLNFDMADILICLEKSVCDLSWVATDMDYDGPDMTDSEFLSYKDLLHCFSLCNQTVDGALFGFRTHEVIGAKLKDIESHFNFLRFPNGICRIIIRAIDSSFFEVYSKCPNVHACLASDFHVVAEDTKMFF